MAGLFKGVKVPEPEPVKPMPDMKMIEADKRRNANKRRASGRISTILSDNSREPLGG